MYRSFYIPKSGERNQGEKKAKALTDGFYSRKS